MKKKMQFIIRIPVNNTEHITHHMYREVAMVAIIDLFMLLTIIEANSRTKMNQNHNQKLNK